MSVSVSAAWSEVRPWFCEENARECDSVTRGVDPQEIRTLPRKQAHHVNLINPSGHLYMVSKRAFQSIQGRNDQLKQKLKARRDSAEVAAERPPSTLRGSPKNASDESPVAQRAAPCLREAFSCRAPTPSVTDAPTEAHPGLTPKRRTRSPTPGYQLHGTSGQGTSTSKEELEEDLFSPTRGRGSLDRDGTPRSREQSRTPTSHGEAGHGVHPSASEGVTSLQTDVRTRKPVRAPPPGKPPIVVAKGTVGRGTTVANTRRPGQAPDSRSEGTDGGVPATRAPTARTHVSTSACSASASDGESDTIVDDQTLSVPSRGSGEVEIESEESEEPGGAGEPDPEEVYDYMDFDPFSFIKSLPPLEQVVPQWRKSLLPRQTRRNRRKTLVLDLDETLVHSTLDNEDTSDFTFPVNFNNREHIVSVKQRPHLRPFLERVADLFEVVVFTASQKIYAEQLLNILDPERRLIRHRVFRDSCVLVDGNYLKDLTVLGRELAHTVIVDNSPQAFGFQLENGIPIESWYDDKEDAELLRLLPFLESLVAVDDVRPLVKETYQLHQKVQQAPDPPPLPL